MPLLNLPFDLRKARIETRGCENMIHFNNAGASLMPVPVSDCLHDYLREEEMHGGYETQNRWQTDLDRFYHSAARLLNCSDDEIAYMENATRAWDMAFYSFRFKQGDRILTAQAEYGSNVVAYLQQAKRYGVEVVFVPDDESGQIDLEALTNLIDERVKLISISHVPTGGGLVNPAAEVGKIANTNGIPYLLDACQSLGQLPLDVNKIGCDILTGTGRKYLRGPRGTGLLYVRNSLLEQLEPPMLDQHAAELISATEYRMDGTAKRFENWEQFCAGKAALARAIDYALDWDLQAIQARIYELATELRTQLSLTPGLNIADQGKEQCGIVTFRINGVDPAWIKQALSKHAINVSTSAGSGSLVDYQARGIEQTVRASLHYYNNQAEIDRFVEVLHSLVKRN